MNLRRSVAALSLCAALGAALGATAAPAAVADDGPAGRPEGLYGTKDPKFDGVWRQSLALLAQDAVGVTPAKSAVDWLAGQQCADGGFAAYRADTSKACDPKKGEFTDAGSAAIQALAALGGRAEAVEKGIGWLKRHQNEDGGWGMNPGGPSDANSTSAAVGAFAAAGQDPAKVTSGSGANTKKDKGNEDDKGGEGNKGNKGGKSPYDALLGLQLGCSAKSKERGAFAYTTDKGEPAANELATASAALAIQGKGFVFETVGKDNGAAPEPLSCASAGEKGGAGTPKEAAEAALAHLSRAMSDTGAHLKSAMPGAKDQPDFGGTADAVVALAAGEHSAAAGKPLRWLQGKDSGTVAWAKGDPGALAKLTLAAHAAGANPRDFGGADLVRQLNATGPKPEAATAQGSASDGEKEEKKSDSGGIGGVWWTVGVCAVAGVGIGFLLSGRKRQQL